MVKCTHGSIHAVVIEGVVFVNPNRFGDFVVEKRKNRGLSLRRMADLLELSPAYWSDIEKGRRNPPALPKLVATVVATVPVTNLLTYLETTESTGL